VRVTSAWTGGGADIVGAVPDGVEVQAAGHWLRTAAISSSPPSITNDSPVT